MICYWWKCYSVIEMILIWCDMNDIDIDIRFSNMREMDGMSKVKGGEMNEWIKGLKGDVQELGYGRVRVNVAGCQNDW